MVDVAVGVITKDCEKSLENILKVLDKELKGMNSTIIVVDGHSKDNTKKIFNDVKTEVEKKLISEKGKKGKGSAVKTFLLKAKELGAETVLLVDGDFQNFNGDLVKKLLKPIMNGADAAFPRYVTDKYDLLIGNHLIYPLTKALFNSTLRNPIIGEAALSRKAYVKLLGDVPLDYGIGIHMSTTLICEGLSIVEVLDGSKDHSSSEQYVKPEEHLMPMFNQILRTFIQITRYYKNTIKKGVQAEIKKSGKTEKRRPKRINIDFESYSELSRNLVENKEQYVELVYKNLNKQSIMGLKVAWLNYLDLFFKETKNMSNADVEKEIEKLAKLFAKKKELLEL